MNKANIILGIIFVIVSFGFGLLSAGILQQIFLFSLLETFFIYIVCVLIFALIFLPLLEKFLR